MEPLEYVSENRRFQAQIEEEENAFKRDCTPPEWLMNAESPFKWLMSLRLQAIFLHDLSRKLVRDERRNNEPESQGENPLSDHQDTSADEEGFESNGSVRFYTPLSVAVMKSVGFRLPVEDGSDIHTRIMVNCEPDNIEEIDKLIARSKSALSEMEAKALYARIGPALHHVLDTTIAHILYLRGNIAESKKMAMKIQPVDEMPIKSKAGIEGVKAQFLMRIYKDCRKALEALLNAAKLDPEFADWNFFIGINIKRLRNEYIEEMPWDELHYFKIAYELNKKPKYLLFLAEAYRDWAMYYLKKEDYKSSEFYNKKAVQLYRECCNFEYDSAGFHRRVGNGLMKISNRDLDLAKKALLKAFEINPFHGLTSQMLGNYYYKHELDDEKALEYFEKAGIRLYSTGEIIRLKLIKYSDYDPGDLIEQLLAVACKRREEDVIYCSAGWYYLYFKEDLDKAAKLFWEVLKKDFKSFRVMEFKSYTLCVEEPLNVIDILVNEIMLLKEKNKSLSPADRKDTTFLECFLEKIFEKHPDFIKRTADPNKMKNIRRKIEYYRDTMRYKRYSCPRNHYNEEFSSWQQTEDAPNIPRNAAGGVRSWGAVKDDFSSQRCTWRSEKQRHGTTGNQRVINKGDRSNCNFDNRGSEYNRDSSYDQRSSGSSTRGGGGRGQYNRYDLTITDWRKK